MTSILLENKVRALRAENDRLREENRQLLRQLTAEDDDLPAGVPHLTRREAAALRAILRRGSISREALFFAIYGPEADVDENLVDVWVHKLRRKLSGSGIRIATDWGRGFRIERTGQAAA